ncbi:MAG: hypothetical protein Q9186_007448 [Xanthomendoza sp. 1 TL-2023]
MVSTTGDSALSVADTDDYMSMTVPEPASTTCRPKTSFQRRARQKREAESRAHPPSKAELVHQAELNRDEALNTALPVTSKGFQMMTKLGFKVGTALGKEGNEHARKEPLGVLVKEGRAGLGMEDERKRKFRDEVTSGGGGQGAKKRETEGEFRERQAGKSIQRRAEDLCWGAMRVLEGFGCEDRAGGEEVDGKDRKAKQAAKKPTAHINVLWRALLWDRVEKEKETRMRYDLHQSLWRDPACDGQDDEEQDIKVWGTEEEEFEAEDRELDEFKSLEPAERLERMVVYLRQEYKYCFWCKFRYADGMMEGCPGISEDEHS